MGSVVNIPGLSMDPAVLSYGNSSVNAAMTSTGFTINGVPLGTSSLMPSYAAFNGNANTAAAPGAGVIKMAGLGTSLSSGTPFVYTPTTANSLLVMFSFIANYQGSGGQGALQFAYGIGAAPVAGANATGTTISALTGGASTVGDYYTIPCFVSGLTIGQTYWFDAQIQILTGTGGPFYLFNNAMSVLELSGSRGATGLPGPAGPGLSTVYRDEFTAGAGQTTFNTVQSYAPGVIDVYQNGLKLVNGIDVTVTSGTQIILASGAALNDTISVVYFQTSAVSLNNNAILAAMLDGSTDQKTLDFRNKIASASLSALAYNNIILNGGMEISQKNGANTVVIGNSTYLIDQWTVGQNGTMVASGQQVTDAPPGYNNSYKFTVGTAETPLGVGDYLFIYQPITGYRTSKLLFGTANAKTVTLGFWTKIHTPGMYSGDLRNGDSTRCYPFSFTQNVADTWEYKTVVIPGDVTGTWLGNVTTASMLLVFQVAVGATYQGPANAWASVNYLGVTGSTNGVATTAETFQITGITLLPDNITIPSTIASSLMRYNREELLLCQISGFDPNPLDFVNTVSAAPNFALMHNNILINGGMEVSQLNGASANTVAGNYQVDQWKVSKVGTMVCTAQQVTDAPSGYNNSLKVTVGTAESSLAAGDYTIIFQPLEGYRVSKLAFGLAGAQTVTVGFWTKIHRTGTYSGSIQNVAGTRSYPFNFTQNVADTWEYKTVVVPGDITGTWIGNTNAQWGNIIFAIGVGTTFSGAANAWSASNFFGATGSTNGVAATSDVFQITGVTLLPGNLVIPSAMAPNFIRPYSEELLLCQRYFNNTIGFAMEMPVTSASDYGHTISFPTMRGTPGSITASDSTTTNLGAPVALNAISTSAIEYRKRASGTGSGALISTITADARL